MNRTKQHGITALNKEGYNLPKQAFVKIRNSAYGFWLSAKSQIVLTVVLSLCDGVVLFTLMDSVMLQNQFLGIITTVTFAFILNFSAIVAAYLLRHAIYRTQRCMWPLFGATIAAFVLLAGCITNLRYRAPELYETPTATTTLVNTVEVGETQDAMNPSNDHTERNYAIILLLSMSPVVTSVLNFLIAFICADPVKHEYEALQLRNLELNEELSEIRSALLTMDSIEDAVLGTLQAMFRTEVGELMARAQEMRAIAIQELEANMKGNHDAISKLSAESLSSTNEFSRRLSEMITHHSETVIERSARPHLYLAVNKAANERTEEAHVGYVGDHPLEVA